MNCATNLCTQGRQPCPTPWQCGNTMHRVTPPLSYAEVADAEFEQAKVEDEGVPALLWALLVVVAAFVVGIVALPFLLGAI